jgi:hypothetical protein
MEFDERIGSEVFDAMEAIDVLGDDSQKLSIASYGIKMPVARCRGRSIEGVGETIAPDLTSEVTVVAILANARELGGSGVLGPNPLWTPIVWDSGCG